MKILTLLSYAITLRLSQSVTLTLLATTLMIVILGIRVEQHKQRALNECHKTYTTNELQ